MSPTTTTTTTTTNDERVADRPTPHSHTLRAETEVRTALHRAQANSMPCSRAEGKREGYSRDEYRNEERAGGVVNSRVGMPAVGGGGTRLILVAHDLRLVRDRASTPKREGKSEGIQEASATMHYCPSTCGNVAKGFTDARQSTNTRSARRTADQRRKESRFTELEEIERREGRGPNTTPERTIELPSLKQATKFSTDLLGFQKNV